VPLRGWGERRVRRARWPVGIRLCQWLVADGLLAGCNSSLMRGSLTIPGILGWISFGMAGELMEKGQHVFM
jgi:hypothetical protein